MSSKSMGRRALTVAGGAALIALGAMTAACGNGGNQAPSPTEKNLSPTGGNLFTPPVIAPPAPTEPPGVHRKH